MRLDLGRITSMIVDERHLGSDFGRASTVAAEYWFATTGCVKLEVMSRDRPPDAHRFYRKHGFLRDGMRLSKEIGH
ncbi:GNAT family N-acetyltransferase [Caballeronia sp. DA-9]|uniref:GNAT family N-acetyltransferase n=1 Tax=Caballeronia sp. DA-9 TaxID=3436237 RepID=UPI003F66E19B